MLIKGPLGAVRISNTGSRLKLEPQTGTVSGVPAMLYAEVLLHAALETALSHPLPWSEGREGAVKISQQQQYYAQTFCAVTAGIERLRAWRKCRFI